MDKSSILKGFNNHFMEFVNAVRDYFSDNKDVRATGVALEGIRKVNPKLIMNIWKEYIVDVYSTEIEGGEIEFFINKEYKNDLNDLQNSNSVLEAIEKLRDPVKAMPGEDQEKVMKYIQNLTNLSKLYFQ
jgi:hypothetical protein